MAELSWEAGKWMEGAAHVLVFWCVRSGGFDHVFEPWQLRKILYFSANTMILGIVNQLWVVP